MKQKHNGGYSLIEVLIAIVVLGIITVPVCTSLERSIEANVFTKDLMQAQLAVSSAVETLMAEGIADASPETTQQINDRFPELIINIEEVYDDGGNMENYFRVSVTNDAPVSVTVETCIRQTPPAEEGGEADEEA